MGAPRFFCPDIAADANAVELPATAAHHAAHVLRLKAGDPVVLFDGQGGEYHGVVSRAAKDAVAVSQIQWLRIERESPVPVTLAQALCSAEKMDFIMQKAVELGVARIQPVAARRSQVRLPPEKADKRLRHWRSVAAAACEQCGRNRMPEIGPVVPLSDWIAALRNEPADEALRLMLAPTGTASLRELPRPSRGVCLLVGPEGGWDPAEEKDAERAGFSSLRLGQRTLRTETAALAALAAIQVLWGDF